MSENVTHEEVHEKFRKSTADLQRDFTESMVLVTDDDPASMTTGLRQAEDADGNEVPLAGEPDTNPRPADGSPLVTMEIYVGLRVANENLLNATNGFCRLRNELGAVADIVGIDAEGGIVNLTIAVALGNRHEVLGTNPFDETAPLRKDTVGARGYWLMKRMAHEMYQFHPHFIAVPTSDTARNTARALYRQYPKAVSVADALLADRQRARRTVSAHR